MHNSKGPQTKHSASEKKNEIGKITKNSLEKIKMKLTKTIALNQWKNTKVTPTDSQEYRTTARNLSFNSIS